MNAKLKGRIAMIPGRSAGIGLATAKRFVAEGAEGFITGQRQAKLDKAMAEIGDHATGLQGDATSLIDLNWIYEAVTIQAGHIDVLPANAGVYGPGVLRALSEAHVDEIFGMRCPCANI